jgi:PAS domain S-box-containing protein
MNKSEPTVLCVNDHREQLELLEVQLRQAGYRVLTALDGAEATELAKRERPDLIISDVLMPRMSGVELCRAVRADAEIAGTPIMLLSALRKDTENVVEGLRAGADEYLEAPYNSMRLVALAARLIERKQADDALRESEERYRRLVELSPETIFIHSGGRIVFINEAGVSLLGAERAEQLLGRRVLDFIHPDHHEAVSRRMVSVEAGASVPFAERRFVRLDGSTVEVELAATPFTYEGRQGVQCLVHDLTQLKKLEEQLLQSQKMESVGRLAGGVAHDFNNLLVAINGYSELTLRRLGADDPLRRNVEEIRKAGERAAALTRQLLAFSRKQVLQPKVLCLNDVVSDMDRMLKRVIGEDVELSARLDPDLGYVKADPTMLEQVVLNLCVNSRDAMPGGGRLTVETSNVTLGEEYAGRHVGVRPGSYVALVVSDTGCGMDAETRQHIFEPFFTTKEQGKGTGLGLATVYGVVQQSGGHIRVYSDVGHGATFRIYLPRVDKAAKERAGESDAAAQPAGMEKVLLVEDDEMVRCVAREIISAHGYTVLEARSMSEAVRHCAENSDIALLLTDVVMPKMNGQELAERLRQLLPRVRVLFMSGYTETVVHEGVLDRGLNFIQKPFTPTSLLRKIREVLDGESADARSTDKALVGNPSR